MPVVIIVGGIKADADVGGVALSCLMVFAISAKTATLETPLMPFRVWVAFREIPAVHALIGGALVIGAVVADIAVDMRTRDRS